MHNNFFYFSAHYLLICFQYFFVAIFIYLFINLNYSLPATSEIYLFFLAGLAHFLEHMLFMGTKTFPQENAYQLYLSNHGGSSNAYTAQDHTIYYFDVACDSLRGALEIFASFFICPLFNEDALDRYF